MCVVCRLRIWFRRAPGYTVVRLKNPPDYRSLNIALSADSARPSRGAARKYMPHNKCWRSAHRLLAGCPHPLDVSLFYVLQFWCVIGLNILTSGSIKLPEAFCAGTTAAYRKGNGSNSALTPSITCIRRSPLHPSITPAPGLARRLRHVPRLRHLQRHELGQRADGCRDDCRV